MADYGEGCHIITVPFPLEGSRWSTFRGGVVVFIRGDGEGWTKKGRLLSWPAKKIGVANRNTRRGGRKGVGGVKRPGSERLLRPGTRHQHGVLIRGTVYGVA